MKIQRKTIAIAIFALLVGLMVLYWKSESGMSHSPVGTETQKDLYKKNMALRNACAANPSNPDCQKLESPAANK